MGNLAHDAGWHELDTFEALFPITDPAVSSSLEIDRVKLNRDLLLEFILAYGPEEIVPRKSAVTIEQKQDGAIRSIHIMGLRMNDDVVEYYDPNK